MHRSREAGSFSLGSEESIRRKFHGKNAPVATFRVRPEIVTVGPETISPTGRVETFRDFKGYLNHLISRGVPLQGIDGQDWNLQNLKDLKSRLDVVDESSASDRIHKMEESLPEGINPLARFMATRLANIKPCRRARMYAVAIAFMEKLPVASRTRPEDKPEPAPPEAILNKNLLDETLTYVNASESDSVAAQLSDPLIIAAHGVSFRTDMKNGDHEINYGFTIPTQLLKILEAIRHEESNNIFKDWLVGHCTTEAGVYEALAFLKVLINFTSFLDSGTHLELFGSKSPGREKEVVNNPFIAIRDAIVSLGRALHQRYGNHPVRGEFRELIDIFELRYGEVYNSPRRASLFTAHEQALATPPKDFATLAFHISRDRKDFTLVADALLKFAEASGVSDIGPLLTQFSQNPQLYNELVREGKRVGYLDDHEVLHDAYNSLVSSPWEDAADIDFSTIIRDGVTRVRFHLLTGTYGPMTRGHVGAIESLMYDIDSRPKKNDDSVQDLILVIPAPDVGSIQDYGKSVSRVGTLEQRVWTMFTHLASTRYDRTKIFITTSLQPDPSTHKSSESRAQETCNRLVSQIIDNMRKAKRAAGFMPEFVYLFGTDEIKLGGNPKTLAPRSEQKWKINTPGSTAIIRSGQIADIMKCASEIKHNTGISSLIFTPHTLLISSSVAQAEIGSNRIPRSVAPAAQTYVSDFYSAEAKRTREEKPSETLAPKSVTEMYLNLIDDMERRLKIVI